MNGLSEYYVYGNDLFHYGTKGRSGRYKWGTGDRPYQRLETAKPKRYKKSLPKRISERRAEKKAARAKAKADQKAREIEAERKRYLDQQKKLRDSLNKEELLKEGKASEILKYESVLTNQELQEALNRINTRAQLAKISANEIQTGWQKMDDAMKKVKNVNDWTSTGIATAKNIQEIMKLLGDATEKYQQKQKEKNNTYNMPNPDKKNKQKG